MLLLLPYPHDTRTRTFSSDDFHKNHAHRERFEYVFPSFAEENWCPCRREKRHCAGSEDATLFFTPLMKLLPFVAPPFPTPRTGHLQVREGNRISWDFQSTFQSGMKRPRMPNSTDTLLAGNVRLLQSITAYFLKVLFVFNASLCKREKRRHTTSLLIWEVIRMQPNQGSQTFLGMPHTRTQPPRTEMGELRKHDSKYLIMLKPYTIK